MTFSDFSMTVSKNLFQSKLEESTIQNLFTFLRLQMVNRMSIKLFSLLNQGLRIRLFGRRVCNGA